MPGTASVAIASPYGTWIREEYIEATPGEVIDYDRIRAKNQRAGRAVPDPEIAIDRWNATQLAIQLTDDGFEVVPFGQGYASMNWPTKKLEEVVRAGRLRGGNPVLRWMATPQWPSKKKSRERTDGIVALIMGLDRASRHPWRPDE